MGKSSHGVFEYLPAGDEFFNLLTQYRTLWLSGRPGGGKTSAALFLALRLVAGGYATGIATNTPLILDECWTSKVVDSAEAVIAEHDVAIIVDEAWGEIGQGNDKGLKRWLAYPRKFNQYLMFPSVLAVHRQISHFRLERLVNLMLMGVPCWGYRYSLGVALGDEMRGMWYWWRPSQIFQFYNHKAVIGSDYYVYRYTPTEA